MTPESAQVQVGVRQKLVLKDVPFLPTTIGPWSGGSRLAVGALIFSLSLRPLEFALGSILSDGRTALFLLLEVFCLV